MIKILARQVNHLNVHPRNSQQLKVCLSLSFIVMPNEYWIRRHRWWLDVKADRRFEMPINLVQVSMVQYMELKHLLAPRLPMVKQADLQVSIKNMEEKEKKQKRKGSLLSKLRICCIHPSSLSWCLLEWARLTWNYLEIWGLSTDLLELVISHDVISWSLNVILDIELEFLCAHPSF